MLCIATRVDAIPRGHACFQARFRHRRRSGNGACAAVLCSIDGGPDSKLAGETPRVASVLSYVNTHELKSGQLQSYRGNR